MKDIKDMNNAELAHHLEHHVHYTRLEMIAVIERLRELHEQTRWIPVEERMPTEADADRDGFVEWWDVNIISLPRADYWDTPHSYSYWRRITPPEESK